MTTPADYVIHGAGGIGCVVAARLAASGRSVTLIARGAHLDALQRRGLQVKGSTEADMRLAAVGHPAEAELAPGGVVLLTMKTNDTAAALDDAGAHYDGVPLLCFQNGVANEDIVAGRGLRSYGCVVIVGGRILEPGVVAHTSGFSLTLGVWPTGVDDVCERVAADLVAAGMKGRTHADVRAAKWGKLFRNLNNAYLALGDLSLQTSSRYEEHRRFMADVQEEALDVIEAAGITLDVDDRRTPREQIARLREPGEWTHVEVPDDPDRLVRPSTWQDLHFQRGQVEVDYFNGEIVRLAERLGRDAPLNRIVRDRCVDAAVRRLLPGTETAQTLRIAASMR
ncbi:MAG: 2-dehydropantoate 2-reductase [Acidimicrobiia bacterium]|nr:2-dehydropantoate 2-reductase [Acidimicrobiia bacterium]